MPRSRMAVAFLVAAASVLAGCGGSGGGSAESNCRRFLEIVEDIRDEQVAGTERLDRIVGGIGDFPSGTPLWAAYNDIVSSLALGDEENAAAATDSLEQQCKDLLAR